MEMDKNNSEVAAAAASVAASMLDPPISQRGSTTTLIKFLLVKFCLLSLIVVTMEIFSVTARGFSSHKLMEDALLKIYAELHNMTARIRR